MTFADRVLPPRDHPVYRLLNRLISLAGLLIVVYYLLRYGLRSGRPDTSDALGGVMIVKLAAELLGNARRSPPLEQESRSMSKTDKLLKILAIAQVFVPQALQFTKLAPISNQVRDIIVGVGQIPGASGSDKLARAVEATKTVISAINTQENRVVVDPTLSDAAIASIVGTAYDVAKLLHDLPHEAKVQPPAFADVPVASPPQVAPTPAVAGSGVGE